MNAAHNMNSMVITGPIIHIRHKIKFFSPKCIVCRCVSRIFERRGPISLGSLKKGHQILKGGGVQWSNPGGGGDPVH